MKLIVGGLFAGKWERLGELGFAPEEIADCREVRLETAFEKPAVYRVNVLIRRMIEENRDLAALLTNLNAGDILFIDEGFGTLSEDYLNVVMDTLERLHQMGGKKVGIISHVEGLRERIKTQIQVRRIDNSRSEILTVSLV